MKVHGLVTCRNRREMTRRSLDQLFKQFDVLGIQFSLTLVDGGSSDGTLEMLGSCFNNRLISIIRGDGGLYWAGGMRYGWESFAKKQSFDYLLIFNDDINLYENAIHLLIKELMDLQSKYKKVILVAPFYDADEKTISYSGFKNLLSFYPLKNARVKPDGNINDADTFNCNLVFVHRDVLDCTGFFKDYFIHSGADIEYGLRAKKNGANIFVSKNSAGVCSRNDVYGTSYEEGISPLERFKRRHSIKESPHKQKFLFMKEHGGRFWFLFWLYSYFKILFK